MSLKKMRIRITQAGRAEIRVEGGDGADCLAFTQAVEQALGQVERREMTEDYYKESEPATASETERVTL